MNAEINTCDFCRNVTEVNRQYLHAKNQPLVGDGFAFIYYCKDCGLKEDVKIKLPEKANDDHWVTMKTPIEAYKEKVFEDLQKARIPHMMDIGSPEVWMEKEATKEFIISALDGLTDKIREEVEAKWPSHALEMKMDSDGSPTEDDFGIQYNEIIDELKVLVLSVLKKKDE